MPELNADAVVVGGGLVGAASAVALARAGLSVIHLAPKGKVDHRTSALMMPSVDYLRNAGLIHDPAAFGNALNQIRIIDATPRLLRAPETMFASSESGLNAFGWNFANARLLDAFRKVAEGLENLQVCDAIVVGLNQAPGQTELTMDDGSMLRTALVVGADGKGSLVRDAGRFRTRKTEFAQSALVCDLELARPLGGTSVEFHYADGPFTLVPAGGNRANLVWIDKAQVLQDASAGGGEQFERILAEKSMRLFGVIRAVTPSHIFALSTLSVDQAGADGIVLVGEAAHAFPPIGAQGLNLGLRDVADLSIAVVSSDRTSADWAIVASQEYARRRAADLGRTGGMVDTLFRSLLAEMLPAQAMRAGGLWALKLLPSLRRQAFSIGMGAREEADRAP